MSWNLKKRYGGMRSFETSENKKSPFGALIYTKFLNLDRITNNDIEDFDIILSRSLPTFLKDFILEPLFWEIFFNDRI